MKKWPVIILFYVISGNDAVIYRISDADYDLMPPIIYLDSYESCMRRPGGRYCSADVAFVADEPSPLIAQMQEFSAHTAKHFNHTRSIYGKCVSHKCKHNENSTDLHRAYEACLNSSLYEEYGLKVKILGKFWCSGTGNESWSIGVADIIVAAAVLVLVLLNAVGSVYDICLSHETGKEGLSGGSNGYVAQFILCFSLRRNCRKLMAPPSWPDPRLNRFKGITGVRGIFMILVIMAHAIVPGFVGTDNPKFVEDQYDNILMHTLLNGTVIMQIFLFLSAFLMVYYLQIYEETHQLSWSIWPKGVIRRYLRLTPSYALVLGVTATWQKYAGSGPSWDRIVVSEADDCRRDWWKFLLYFNNYVDDSQCMPQAWYLATDTQLFLLGLTVCMLCRTPTARKVVLPMLFIVGLIMPALHTYFQDLDAAVIASPEAAAGFFTSDETFNKVYKRGHTNIPTYAMGLALGYIVYQLQKDNFDASKYKKWRPLYWMMIPIGLGIPMSCSLFYRDGPRINIYWRVLLSIIIRPAFGLCAAVVIPGMIFKMDNFCRGILEWRGWSTVGRTSYSAYLVHMACIRVSAGALTAPIHTTYWRLVEMSLASVVVSYLLAHVFWLAVEAPLSALVKVCLDPKNPVTKENVDCENMNSKL